MNLLSILKNNEKVRKIFGKREIIIIEKQIRGVKLTQSEKNRLSRDIRKKFEVIKELNKFENEFDLKKGTYNKKIINELLETIKETEFFPRIKRIILFGSSVENELTLMSDIDVAVDFEKISKKEAFNFCLKIRGIFSSKVDLQVYNVLPDKIKKQIDKNGKLLYKK